jgi:hypothetical protein
VPLVAFLFRQDTDDDQLPFHNPVFDTPDTHQQGRDLLPPSLGVNQIFMGTKIGEFRG